MAEFNLSYTAEDINTKLGKIDTLEQNVNKLNNEKVPLNQGSANVGKILVVGADGNLTLADMPTGTSGDVIGMIDENNNIVITGDLADGTYVFRYENADGTYADIGSLVVGNAEPEPSYTNLADPTASGWVNNSRIGSNGADKGEGACTGAVVTNFIHVPDRTKILYIKGLDIVNKLPDGNVTAFSRYSSADLSSYIALCYSGTFSAHTTVTGDVSAFDPSGNVLDGEYIRMTGTLLDGYTAEDVIITLGEPIE